MAAACRRSARGGRRSRASLGLRHAGEIGDRDARQPIVSMPFSFRASMTSESRRVAVRLDGERGPSMTRNHSEIDPVGGLYSSASHLTQVAARIGRLPCPCSRIIRQPRRIRLQLRQNHAETSRPPAAVAGARAAARGLRLPQGRDAGAPGRRFDGAVLHPRGHAQARRLECGGKEMILRFAAETDIDTSYAAWRLRRPCPTRSRGHQGCARPSFPCRSGSSFSSATPR
jgi:hypothetical protein